MGDQARDSIEPDDLRRGNPPDGTRPPGDDTDAETLDQTPPGIQADAPLPAADYELGQVLGAGGMGTVYRAVQMSLEKTVAVKVLKPRAGPDPDSIDRFVAEAKAVARMRHPNIVGIQGLGRFPDGSYFLVMDFVEGGDLARRLTAGPLSVSEAAAIVVQVADALEHAHRRGIVHRDLKPSNVLIDADGRAMVVDFGLAKRVDADPSLTDPDRIVGSPRYMAPEQADSRWGLVGPRTDIHGLGVLLYALLSGRAPYEGAGAIEVMTRVASPEPPPPIGRPDVPEAMAAIVARCLSKRPEDRFGSAREVAEALRSVGSAHSADSQDVVVNTPKPVITRRSAAMKGRYLLLGVPSLLVIALAWTAWRGPTPPPGPSPITIAPPPSGPSPIAVSPPPSGPGPITVSWAVLRGRDGRIEDLVKAPGAIREGDSLEIECRLSRAAYPYLFWVESKGRIRLIYPEANGRNGPVSEVPRRPIGATASRIGFVARSPEVGVLLVMESPLAAEDLAALSSLITERKRAYRSKSMTLLSRDARLPALEGRLPWIDGRPISGFETSSRGFEVVNPDARLLQFLKPEGFPFRAVRVGTIALPYESDPAPKGQ
jgi:serine/threonine protein kinase